MAKKNKSDKKAAKAAAPKAAAPEVTPEVAAAPEVTPEVVAAPEVTPEVAAAPEVTPEVAAAPEVTPEVAAAPPAEPQAEPKKASTISAALVKELREKTGAGMMDCKKALNETGGDMEKASEWLRQKGISSAEKKASRVAAEGLVGSYIHTGGRVGVLVEVNCETDFVARRDEFQELVRNVAMQVAACPNVEYVKVGDIPAEFVEKEKSIEMGRDDLGNKPAEIKAKIIEGRISKRLKEVALLDQPYVKDQSITVDEMVKQVSGKIGEKIEIRRFCRFVLGEGIEKQESDFAAEVAAQAGLV